MHRTARIQVRIEKRAFVARSHAAKIPLMFFLLLCYQHFGLAQFRSNTKVSVDSDIHAPIGVAPDDLMLKTEDGKVFATIQNYQAKLTMSKGSTIEIHRQGGFLDNMKWFKGR